MRELDYYRNEMAGRLAEVNMDILDQEQIIIDTARQHQEAQQKHAELVQMRQSISSALQSSQVPQQQAHPEQAQPEQVQEKAPEPTNAELEAKLAEAMTKNNEATEKAE